MAHFVPAAEYCVSAVFFFCFVLFYLCFSFAVVVPNHDRWSIGWRYGTRVREGECKLQWFGWPHFGECMLIYIRKSNLAPQLTL